MLGLKVGIVPRPDGSHRGRLVPGVGLGRVLEVRVGTSRAVDADVARHADVRASVRLAHDGDDGDLKNRGCVESKQPLEAITTSWYYFVGAGLRPKASLS